MFWKNIKEFPRRTFLYKFTVFSSFVGIVFPPLSLVSKLKANDGYYLKKLSDKLSYNFNYDLLNYFPNWHYGEDIGMGGGIYYIRWSIYALICFALLIYFGEKINIYCKRTYQVFKSNKIIFAFILFLIFTYQAKFFSGWWFYGIAGWHYQNRESKFLDNTLEQSNVPRYLLQTINRENVEKLHQHRGDFCLPGESFVAFNQANQSFPINLGLLEIVFPWRFLESKIFLDLLNYKIASLHSYQNHYPEHSICALNMITFRTNFLFG